MKMDLARYISQKKGDAMVYMPYLTIGDPSLARTVEFACAMIEAGADLVELGIPFSDPTADGPVIQAAMDRSLQIEFHLHDVFAVCRKIHNAHPRIPLVLLSYLNPILSGFSFMSPKGDYKAYLTAIEEHLSLFLKECQRSGVQALVIPDLPFDQAEAVALRSLFDKYGVAEILMIAPNTKAERLTELCKAARGWLYYVSNLGVTGMRDALSGNLSANIQRVRKLSDLPILAGFGFHRTEQVRGLRGLVDGVIVGSMNQRIIAEGEEGALEALRALTTEFATACHVVQTV